MTNDDIYTMLQNIYNLLNTYYVNGFGRIIFIMVLIILVIQVVRLILAIKSRF